MGVRDRVRGLRPDDPAANATMLSSQVVNAYAAPLRHLATRARWDCEDEAPLRDARGWELARSAADASQLTDEVAETDDPMSRSPHDSTSWSSVR